MYTQKNNSQHIIVYRSKGEELTDEFLYEEGGLEALEEALEQISKLNKSNY